MDLKTIQAMRKVLNHHPESRLVIEGGESDHYFVGLHQGEEVDYLKNYFGHIKMFHSLDQVKTYLRRKGFKDAYLDTHSAYEEMHGHDERPCDKGSMLIHLRD